MKTIAYHYTDTMFDFFDEKKADGFWFTTIDPSDFLNANIGNSGSGLCAVCEIVFNEDTAIKNGGNYDIFEAIDREPNCDAIVNDYDRPYCDDAIVNDYDSYTDFALRNNSQIKILEWINLC